MRFRNKYQPGDQTFPWTNNRNTPDASSKGSIGQNQIVQRLAPGRNSERTFIPSLDGRVDQKSFP